MTGTAQSHPRLRGEHRIEDWRLPTANPSVTARW